MIICGNFSQKTPLVVALNLAKPDILCLLKIHLSFGFDRNPTLLCCPRTLISSDGFD
jgi:hypothetical protein